MDKKKFFTRVYDVLIEHAGASDDEIDRLSFELEFCKDSPTSQYRFQGSLGFGGKFFYPAFNVSYYPEDETPARLDAKLRTNAALTLLRVEYQSTVNK